MFPGPAATGVVVRTVKLCRRPLLNFENTAKVNVTAWNVSGSLYRGYTVQKLVRPLLKYEERNFEIRSLGRQIDLTVRMQNGFMSPSTLLPPRPVIVMAHHLSLIGRRRRPPDQERDALFIGTASERLRIRIESRQA